MRRVETVLKNCKEKLPLRAKTAFFSAFGIGLLVHLPAMLLEIPNHDGLGSLYFDQNMITSGRWFLSVACGISSFYSVPWVIGLLGLLWLGITAALLTELLEVRGTVCAAMIGGLLASFPSLASTFAYVFTLDGYLLGLLLAVLAVYLTKRRRGGWFAGGIALALSLGIYQAYLPFAMLLSIFCIALYAMSKGSSKPQSSAHPASSIGDRGFPGGERVFDQFRYVYLGICGAALYYLMLQILLKIERKELDTYQGIDGLGGGMLARGMASLPEMYRDFFRFSFSKAFLQNGFGTAAMAALFLAAAALLVRTGIRHGWHRRAAGYGVLLFAVLAIPPAANIVLFVTPDVNYHLMMRLQWALFPIFALALIERLGGEGGTEPESRADGEAGGGRWGERLGALAGWAALACGIVLIFCYGLADNIGYTNLQRRYEKTYAYCIRLLDRIEQTEGYYPGIPVAIVGVVGEEQFPPTDITGDVTGAMIGLSGDYLLYSPRNYEAFFRNYLGASLNFLEPEAVAEIYYSEEYIGMESFPGETSVKLLDGVICVKTENTER